MCGIAGILSFREKLNQGDGLRIIRKLIHRGPDGEKEWFDEDKSLVLAHSRLSIIDVSEKASQPMHFSNNRYTITFNGEIYNYLEIAVYLKEKGYTFKSDSDTEILLALFDDQREKCFERIDGAFAFVIWDNFEKRLFCARDRFGEKPFYYTFRENKFSFASEIKALQPVVGELRVSDESIFNFLHNGIVEVPGSNQSFYSEIEFLEASHFMWVSQDGRIEKKRYWNINLKNRIELNESEYYSKFRELFSISVARRLRSDVPVGSCLSGGLDSSSIVKEISRQRKNAYLQKSFSAVFPGFSKNEEEYIDLVVKDCDFQSYKVVPNADGAYKHLKQLVYTQEQPFSSLSVYNQFEVMKLANQNGIKVLLDGQGADEILAGYLHYFKGYLVQLYCTDKPAYQAEKRSIEKYQNLHVYNPSISDLINHNHPGLFQKYFWLRKRLRKPTHQSYKGINPELVRKVSNFEEEPITNLQDQLYHSTMVSGLNDLLRYADRNSMANSVEVRLPFLFHELVEFVFSVPDNYKIRDGLTKYMLRKSMDKIVPDQILQRRDKIGFAAPQNEWMESDSFKTLLNESVSYLKDNRIIIRFEKDLSWKYIMAYLYMNRWYPA